MTSSAERTVAIVVALAAAWLTTAGAAGAAGVPPAATPDTAIVAGVVPASDTLATASAPDAAAAERVRVAFGARWSVAPESIRLQWGRLPAAGLPATTFRLLGGTDGWFVLAFGTRDGQASSVRVRAGADEPVCVAARDLARDASLTTDDIKIESRLRWGAPRVRAERPAPGWTLRRAVAAGTPLDRPTVQPPVLVHMGDGIELSFHRGAVAMRMSGVAMHDARLGDAVRVRVEGRPRPLLGLVDAPGHARIGAREAS